MDFSFGSFFMMAWPFILLFFLFLAVAVIAYVVFVMVRYTKRRG